MAQNGKHYAFYARITETLTRLGIKHSVWGAWGNDVIEVSFETLYDAEDTVRQLQEVCGPTVLVYWNPVAHHMCVDDR
jgi:hypothetical protein